MRVLTIGDYTLIFNTLICFVLYSAYIQDIYQKLLKETRFGAIDQREWYQAFPGLFELSDRGKKRLKDFEKAAERDARDVLTEDELDELNTHLKGSKPGVLERAILGIKRFCQNPFFGEEHRGQDILTVPSCVDGVLSHPGVYAHVR